MSAIVSDKSNKQAGSNVGIDNQMSARNMRGRLDKHRNNKSGRKADGVPRKKQQEPDVLPAIKPISKAFRDQSGYEPPSRAGKVMIKTYVDPEKRQEFNNLAKILGITAQELLEHVAIGIIEKVAHDPALIDSMNNEVQLSKQEALEEVSRFKKKALEEASLSKAVRKKILKPAISASTPSPR